MSESSESAEYCRRIIAEHSKSFSLASRLLPQAARDDAVAVYAWCRRCDDAIDESPPGGLKSALEELQREVQDLFDGKTMATVVGRALQEVVARRRIPRVYLDELLAGMATDAAGVWAPTVVEFRRYCYRVAGVVGLMMCHVLGVADRRALPHAAHLGMGMQMTNIARDVAEDWRRGRLYLPTSLLRRAAVEVSPETTLTPQLAETISPAVQQILQWADAHYISARHGFIDLDVRAAWAVKTAADVYQRIGRRIARQRFDVLEGRAAVPKATKIWLAGAALLPSLVRKLHRDSEKGRRFQPPDDILTFEQVPTLVDADL